MSNISKEIVKCSDTGWPTVLPGGLDRRATLASLHLGPDRVMVFQEEREARGDDVEQTPGAISALEALQ